MLLQGRADDHVVLIDAATGVAVTAGAIRTRAAEVRRAAGRRRRVVLLPCDGTVATARDVLALLEARVPVIPVPADLDPDARERLCRTYALRLVDGGTAGASEPVAAPDPHPDLALLLPTSGSTGSVKLVRLSAAAVRANAEQIVESLDITATDCAFTVLPLHYAYGMSVLTSHALAGSPVVVGSYSVMQRECWDVVRRYAVTTLAGVPHTYRLLRRLGLPPADAPTLRVLTQAGGRLEPDLIEHFHDLMAVRGGRFHVMYGQTEAGPRMTCTAPADLVARPGSVGRALRGGRLEIVPATDSGGPAPDPVSSGTVGEVVYHGPNVMWGYAERADDLAAGDRLHGRLVTGDLGYLDAAGYLYLTGRRARFAKVAGVRVALDDVERLVRELAPAVDAVAAVDPGQGRVAVVATGLAPDDCPPLRRALAARLGVAAVGVDVRAATDMPLLGSGKTDYGTLAAWVRTQCGATW